MSIKAWKTLGGMLAIVTLGSLAAVWAGGDYVGSETCAACHAEVVRSFAGTAHAVAPGWDAEKSCESCHGPGQEHAEDGSIETIVRPQTLSPREASENCLSCHSREEKQFASRHSLHSLADVSCIDCHQAHSTAAAMIDTPGTELCASCHQTTAAQFELPRAHPLPDETGCQSCHDPHSAVSPRASSGRGNPTCDNCHFDKAGPFLYAHDVSLVDDCSSCHTVHGSSNRHLLEHERQINLCYQCHPANHTPTFHNAANFLNEKCTACHTAIHGSNTNPFFLEE